MCVRNVESIHMCRQMIHPEGIGLCCPKSKGRQQEGRSPAVWTNRHELTLSTGNLQDGKCRERRIADQLWF